MLSILFRAGRDFLSGLAGIIFALLSNCVAASIVIDGTRVIYPSDKSEVSMRLTNEGADSKLVQVWIDDGDRQASPDKIKVPFIVINPIFRMDPKNGQVTRIQYINNAPLPMDRESVFWLNVLEIPAKPSGAQADENYLQFRYRTRIKLFYRPKGLSGSGSSADAPDNLSFRYKSGYIEVKNPTAYYVSLGSLEVGEGSVLESADPYMLEPFSTATLKLKGQAGSIKNPKVLYKAINDYGGAPVREKVATGF